MKRIDRQSLFLTAAVKIALRAQQVRKDPAVHVSLSSDLVVKQPGTENRNLRSQILVFYPSHFGEGPSKPRASDRGRRPFPRVFIEELRWHVVAPTQRHASEGGYMSRPVRLSTPNDSKSHVTSALFAPHIKTVKIQGILQLFVSRHGGRRT